MCVFVWDVLFLVWLPPTSWWTSSGHDKDLLHRRYVTRFSPAALRSKSRPCRFSLCFAADEKTQLRLRSGKTMQFVCRWMKWWTDVSFWFFLPPSQNRSGSETALNRHRPPAVPFPLACRPNLPVLISNQIYFLFLWGTDFALASSLFLLIRNVCDAVFYVAHFI